MKKLVWFVKFEDKFVLLGDENQKVAWIAQNLGENEERLFKARYMTDKEIADLSETEELDV